MLLYNHGVPDPCKSLTPWCWKHRGGVWSNNSAVFRSKVFSTGKESLVQAKGLSRLRNPQLLLQASVSLGQSREPGSWSQVAFGRFNRPCAKE